MQSNRAKLHLVLLVAVAVFLLTAFVSFSPAWGKSNLAVSAQATPPPTVGPPGPAQPTPTPTAAPDETQNSGICDRTQQVQDAILARLAAVSDCALVTESDLNGITGTLSLYRNGILALRSGDFDGLDNLEILSLGRNQITVLPEDVFDGLDNLTFLTLSGNQISALPEDVFDGLDSLENLNLDGNQISALPEDVFDGLDSLEQVHLGDNQISVLPEDVFDGLDNLINLLLGSNQISVLPEDVFDGLDNLKQLTLGVNQISALPEDVFDGLDNLATLTLNTNQISALPEDVFDGLDNLAILWLNTNQISALPEDVFDGLDNLATLSLNTNRISALPEDVFDGLDNLTSLSLGYNQISALPEDVFDGPDSLVYLSLGYNQISALPEDVFDGLDSLENLSLGSNQISALPEDVFDGLDSLENLGLYQNQISVLPDDVFDGLDSLENLGLYQNQISALPEDVFDGLDSLENLSLGSNQISALPEDVFDGLDSLENLGLYQNQISVLPEDVFDGLDSLEMLNLDGNQISVLPEDVFDGLSTLESLALDDNRLTSLPEGLFEGLTTMKRVDLEDNPGSSFIFKAELEATGGNTFVVKVAYGSPFSMSVTLSATGGTLSVDAVTINGGSIRSAPVTVTPGDAGQPQVTVSIDSATFLVTATSEDDDGYQYNGMQTGRGDSLVLGDANTPATGAPTISGTPQVGVTLSADTSGISDLDGLTNVSFSYQWLSSRDTEISGATSSTYTLQASDAAKTIKVQVSFSDDAGNAESLTSAATAAVMAANTSATGTPTITGTAQVGETLTASATGIADSDGLTSATYTYQWLADDVDISGATTSSYTPVAADSGKAIKVQVSFSDDTGNAESLTSVATAAVTLPPLTAIYHDAPASHDGSTAFTFELRFSETPKSGFSYRVLVDHAFMVTGGEMVKARRLESGKNVGWEMTAEPSGNADVTVSLPVTTDCSSQGAICTWDGRKLSNRLELTVSGPVVSRPNNAATGAPTISGTAQVGQTLTASASGMSDSDGLTNATFAYQWLSSRDTVIDGATSSTYTLVEADEGKAIKVRVSFTDDGGHQETLTSAATAAVAARPNNAATGAPTTSGTVQVGETLTVSTSGITDTDGTTNATFAYQWLSSDGTTDSDISGATSSTYTLVDADEGKVIKVRMSFTDDRGNQETLTSAATGSVAAAPSPLTATIHDEPDSHDGQSVFTFELRFSEEVSVGYRTLRDHGFTVTGGTVTEVRRLERPGNIRWEISVRPAGNRDVTVLLPINTDCTTQGAICTADGRMLSRQVELTVSRPNSAASGAPTISGTGQVGQTLTASTSGISDSDGLTNATFSYQWLSSDSDISGGTSSTYTLVDADEGKVIKVRVSFTDDRGNQETLTSAATGSVAARPNSAASGAPTISGTGQVGQTLTASTSGISDSDGLTNATFSYQWLSSDSDISGGTSSTYTLVDADEGKVIKVRVSFTDDRGNQETLTSAETSEVAAAPSPLTVSLENNPEGHNGTDVFTFQIRFSEQFALSFKTLQDHAFTVDGGTVKRAIRQVKGSNIGWSITVEPDSDTVVRIVLPATTDCDATGAICTEDGRKLSNSLDFTVSGPN